MARNRPIAGQRARAHLTAPGTGTTVLEPPATEQSSPLGTRQLGAPTTDQPEAPATGQLGAAPATNQPEAAATARQKAPATEQPEHVERPLHAEQAGSGRSGTRLLAGLLALTLSALTAFGLVAYQVRSDQRVETARDQAIAAAHDHAQTILSYDYRHLDADFAAARATLTGGFARDYKVTTTTLVRPGAEQYHVVVKAEVAAQSVVSATADQVVVLLFVNQTTTSTRLDGPKVDLNRVRLTLVKTGGSWLVSKVVAL
jgi:Mce-associated membrane protein